MVRYALYVDGGTYDQLIERRLYLANTARRATVVNLFMPEHERKMRETELKRYTEKSLLLAEAHKLDQHPSFREGVATLLIAVAERIAPTAHEAHMQHMHHMHPASQPTTLTVVQC